MISIPKGTRDMLPAEAHKWHYIEDAAREIAATFNLSEIRTPVFEHTELFMRGVGETSDVVTKEMYTFEDKGGRSITLKPEGTAGAARAFVENGLASTPLPLKMYYLTPCFRYERPQKGRLRQFHQFGVEVFGSPAPECDAEVIFAASGFLKKLKIGGVKLEINSIGCGNCRGEYRAALKEYFAPHLGNMCAQCRERFEKNPMRLLDCKEEGCKQIAAGAPKTVDYLCGDCSEHFGRVKSLLDGLNVEYTVNPRIVRGLDYYTRTVFEFISGDIGAQSAVLAGGRYDNLIEGLGGPTVPAVGFAAGIERLLLQMETAGVAFPDAPAPKIFIGGMDGESRKKAFALTMELRANGVNAETDLNGRSVKAQFKYADKLGAKFVAMIGGTEMETGVVNVKKMSDGSQSAVKFVDFITYFN